MYACILLDTPTRVCKCMHLYAYEEHGRRQAYIRAYVVNISRRSSLQGMKESTGNGVNA